ncbi:hypothetical protein [Streptomyces sp. NPDC056669]|uniref:hypothetical protein n=1 Tax=unclassified Streptomyces TaxID=2593676 RepID=UPI00365FBE4E
MTSQLADIPLVNQSHDGELRPTAALRALKKPASRRSVLRGVAASALTVGALSLTWGNSGRAFAEESPSGLAGWDRNDCKDAYPNGYEEQPDVGGQFKNAAGACFGGPISSDYCDADGWFRTGTGKEDGVDYTYEPTSSACGEGETKNAWKWTTPDGKVYRCSDGYRWVTAEGQGAGILSMCRAQVS